ncbi:MAG: ATP-binding protein [Thermodesulfobacteriota bacterium]
MIPPINSSPDNVRSISSAPSINIKSTKDVKVNGVKCAIFGGSGVGKTMLCATAPAPLIVSAEKGLLSLSRVDIPYVDVNSLDDVGEVYKWIKLSDEAKQYKTICLDSLSEITEVLLHRFKATTFSKKGRKDPLGAYLKLADSAGAMIRNFRDLDGLNIVFTAKEIKKEDSDTGIVSIDPMLPGKVLPHGLPYLVDEVFRMQISDGEEQIRFLQTNADRRTTCKDRSGMLDKHEKPDLTYIFNKIKGE